MGITFDSEAQFHWKLHFQKALVTNFQVIYNFPGFHGGPDFPFGISNDVIVMTEIRILKILICIVSLSGTINVQHFTGLDEIALDIIREGSLKTSSWIFKW